MKKVKVYRGNLRTLKAGITFEYYKEKYPDAILIKSTPSMATLEKWGNDGRCKPVCGCGFVEPDGWCGKHNAPSWLIALGLI